MPTDARIDRSPLERLYEDGYAYIGWSHFWRETLRSILLSIETYTEVLLCQNHGRTRAFAWAGDPKNEHGGLAVAPIQADFPLVLTLQQRPATAASAAGARDSVHNGAGSFGGAPSQEPQAAGGPSYDSGRSAGAGVAPPQTRATAGQQASAEGQPAEVGPARTDLAGTMEKVLDRVLNAQRDTMIEGFTQLTDSLGRAGANARQGGKLTSTIKVEPRMAWPEFGDKNKDPEEAENFVRQFESICRMANNGTGMRYEDMVYTIGNCLKGNRTMLFDNIVQDAFEDQTLMTQPQEVYEKIRGRLLMFSETEGERQIRVRQEWVELEKLRTESLLDFEARWEKAHRNMVKAGLVRTPQEDLVDYLKKVGETHSRIIRHEKRLYPSEAVARNVLTWQEAHQIACETERHQRDTRRCATKLLEAMVRCRVWECTSCRSQLAWTGLTPSFPLPLMERMV